MVIYKFPKRWQKTNYIPELREIVDENLKNWYSERCGGKFHAILDFGKESLLGMSKADLIKLRETIDIILRNADR